MGLEYGVATNQSSATATTMVLTVPTGGYAVGDMVVLTGHIIGASTGSLSIADTRGHTWTIDKGGDASGMLFFCRIIVATALLAGDTVTATFGSNARQAMVMFARPSVANLTLDGSASYLVLGTAHTQMVGPASPTMAAPNELVYGVFAPIGPNGSPDSFSVGAGYDLVGSVTGSLATTNRGILVETKRPSDVLALQPYASHGSSNTYYAGTFVLRNPIGVGAAVGQGGVAQYKILGQSNPAATTDATLYTAPTGSQTVISTISVCNTSSATTFRVRVVPSGASLLTRQYLFYDVAIAANQTVTLTAGLTLQPGDAIVVQAGSANVSFQLFGQEIT